MRSSLFVCSDLSAEDLAEAFNVPAHSFPHFHPIASASGTIETRWKGTPRDAEVQFALDLTPPEHHVPAHLRVSAHANGIYHAATDTVELPQFTLTTPTSHIQASGTLSATSAVHLSVSTSSLADWLPFIAVVRGPAIFPVALNGSATFTGNMTGALSSPQLAGNLEVDDFDFILPATAKSHKLKTQWDSLSTSVQLSFHAVTFHGATLRRDNTSAEFDASGLYNTAISPATAPSLCGPMSTTRTSRPCRPLPEYDYPVSGNADLLVQAAGTFSDPHGEGRDPSHRRRCLWRERAAI